ncbi:MAG: 3-hydroxyacyl-ACP dehydratase FabZ [Nanoarchaeota archaeon]|nr:3-hydroxyacyl-ACP dehydratase FabZ [Nanoarchaeota archaeon]MBU1004635.1 3-hydroxyacyl-ACP dehydratase FabZ [Nanoarchaeota archaeon]MBU1946189.1 3-hydroxyacyl-ACP dehydratase FabZ [Nanoarchaeota archaeon]
MKTIDQLKNEKGEIDSNAIKQIIPYEQPFLMIDRVLSMDKTKITAIKNTTANEEFFKGHFAGFPIMPGALIVEGMGQAATLLLRYNLENHWEKEVLAYKIKEAKFSAPTFPGDQLKYEVTMIGKDERGALMGAKATVDDKIVAEAQMMLAVVDRREFRGNASPVYK